VPDGPAFVANRENAGVMPTTRSTRVAGISGVVLGLMVSLGGLSVGQSGDAGCRPDPANPGWTVARQWNEATLEAIRRDLPAPTVHARNLFHVSAAMWDAWAAYDPDVRGHFVDEDQEADDVEAARNEAISYAAYRILESRYFASVGASDSIPRFDALMRSRCLPVDVTTTEGSSPAAVGNRIAAAVLAAGLDDGSNEASGYAAPDYSPLNQPLVVAATGATMDDPNRWQPLQIEQMVSQNGIPVEDGVQQFIGPHWGHVTGFALPDGGDDGLPFDPGTPPRLGDPGSDEEFKISAVEVVELSARLDPGDGETIDISPGALGANPLGTYDGVGHPLNPVTGEPYAPNVVPRADYGRSIAEFWADGPRSETPPGHWNALANTVSDTLDPDLRIGGEGEVVDRLEWDVKLYLALNGANHDAAIAAWGAKGYFDSARPISMIRYMGGLGQSSDPDGPSFHPDGLPLVADQVEVITEETTAPGGRHEALAGHEGEIAIRAWMGRPENAETEVGGVGWILAAGWIPYQLPTFVTPSFAGYISGHSTFSRASAEVLTAITGGEFFPGGLGEWTIPAGSLDFEAGPAEDVVLQWATYYDAADEAGLSRLYGGIHIRADDLDGRVIGSRSGKAAWEAATRLFGGVGA
jgi:hypothetical protein